MRAACGEYPLNGVTVGKTVAAARSCSRVGKFRKETISPSEMGRHTCWLSKSTMKYWCGGTGEGFDTQAGGKYGSRTGAGIWARGGRWFSWSTDGGGGDGTRGRGRGAGTGDGERATGDGVRATGDPGVGGRTWYDGERDGGPKVNSVGASSS